MQQPLTSLVPPPSFTPISQPPERPSLRCSKICTEMHNCAARQLAELRPCGRAGRPAKHTKNNKFLACIQIARRHTTRPSPPGRVLMCTLRIRAAAALPHARATCGKRRQLAMPSAICSFSFPFLLLLCFAYAYDGLHTLACPKSIAIGISCNRLLNTRSN